MIDGLNPVLRCLLGVFVSGSEQDFVLTALRLTHCLSASVGIPTATELQLGLGQTSGVPGAMHDLSNLKTPAQLSYE